MKYSPVRCFKALETVERSRDQSIINELVANSGTLCRATLSKASESRPSTTAVDISGRSEYEPQPRQVPTTVKTVPAKEAADANPFPYSEEVVEKKMKKILEMQRDNRVRELQKELWIWLSEYSFPMDDHLFAKDAHPLAVLHMWPSQLPSEH